MATQLSRTFSSQGNQRKFTISVWVKRSNLTAGQSIFGSGGSGNYATNMYFSGETIRFWNYFNGSYAGQKYSSAVFRDPSAWYHIVFRVDTTSATASERMRIYVNGEEISYSSSVNPNQNQTMEIGHTGTHYIGGYGTGAQAEMCMSHYHYCDGQSYAPTEFGEYDANGVWKIKLEPSVSYGVSGHFLFNNDASVTDQSGLGNNWSVNGGTLTKTEDNPSNVFATMNPLTNFYQNSTFSNGNNRIVTTNDGVYNYNESTLGMSSGKYYMEVKYITSTRPTSDFARFGIVNAPSNRTLNTVGYGLYEYGYYTYNGKIVNNNLQTDYGDTFTDNDIIGIAVDLDNNKLYFSKNGVWQNSGDPTSGATGTGAISITPASDNGTGFYFFAGGEEDGTYGVTFETNFGNGYFGTTAVASAGTNASGNGIFEYDVPTGYTALSTKGLNL